MNKSTVSLKPFLSGALLVSCLGLLSGCDWFKQSDCPSCQTPTAASTEAPVKEDVLLEVDGKPAITKQKFDEFYEMMIASDPQSAYAPGIRQKIYSYLEQAALMDASIRKSKKDQEPEYKKKLEQAFELARIPVNAEVFQKEILDSIDVSPAALESFYKEQAGKNPVFDQPPFMTKQGGVKVQAVQFNDEKSAKDFLAKVQKPGTDFEATAKAEKQNVQNLGVLSSQSKVDRAVITAAKDLQPNALEKVKLSNGKFMVIKGVGPRQPAEYMKFSDITGDETLAGFLKQIKQQNDLQSLMIKRFDDLKKELNAKENTKYLEEKDAQQNAELEALLKSMRGIQEEGAKQPAAQEATVANAAPKPEQVQAETAKSM